MGENHEAATADSLERAGDDQPSHIGGERTDDRSRHEGEDGKNQEGFTPELVGEFAVHRHGDGGEQDEGGNHPAHMLHAMQFAHNGRQGGREDGLVQCRHEHHDDQAGEHERYLMFFSFSRGGFSGFV